MRLSKRAQATRVEDLTWMGETGENAAGAARRLGITEITLERWCRRNHLVDVWRTLSARNPGRTQEVAA